VENRSATSHAVEVHEPDLSFIGGAVVPNDIRVAGRIKVAVADDGPRGPDNGGLAVLAQHRSPPDYAVAVPEPELYFVGLAVVPKNFAWHGAEVLQRE